MANPVSFLRCAKFRSQRWYAGGLDCHSHSEASLNGTDRGEGRQGLVPPVQTKHEYLQQVRSRRNKGIPYYRPRMRFDRIYLRRKLAPVIGVGPADYCVY